MDPLNGPSLTPALYVRPVDNGLPAADPPPGGDPGMAGDATLVAAPRPSGGPQRMDIDALNVPELIEVHETRPPVQGPNSPGRPPRDTSQPQPQPPQQPRPGTVA